MKKFDVFVSFRGIDTRRSFVSHLLLALSKRNITTFKQEEEETPWNQPASSQVLEAIQNSKIAIVVISKNYTASVSCLDELAKIIECKENRSLAMMMIPVLYEVAPSDILGQADNLSFDGDNNLEMVKRWRYALASSIQIYHTHYSYWEDEDSYSYIIDRVMIHVSTRFKPIPTSPKSEPPSKTYPKFKMSRLVLLIPIGIVTMGIGLVRVALRTIARPARRPLYEHKDEYVTGNDLSRLVPSSDFKCLVGMDRQMKAVDTLLLDLASKDGVGEIGIWGVSGVGKTTLARFVYEQISPQFQDHYFFADDTSSNSLRPDSTCLLEELTEAALMETRGSESVYEVVKAKLGHRKVLLIVDGLHHGGHLGNIRKIARWFGTGSRLIFVTQYYHLLLHCEVKRLYEVEYLRYDEALQLFSQFAFKQEHVPRDYHRLSVRAVLITGRMPLALKVFGSFLRGKFINEWEFELCRLEASQDNCVTNVSSYIGNAFS